ncbi:hypothetical protein BEC49_00480 [Escherichia coli]|nr:hypothetical protein [Escherichia coli]
MTVSRKEKNTPTPHDAAFRAFMASAEVARDFVELHLLAKYRQLCDLSTLRLEPCTFVDQDLKQYACDALFSMKTVSGEDGYIYCLAEHLCGAPHKCAYAKEIIMHSMHAESRFRTLHDI